jgi:hypothetical protein
MVALSSGLLPANRREAAARQNPKESWEIAGTPYRRQVRQNNRAMVAPGSSPAGYACRSRIHQRIIFVGLPFAGSRGVGERINGNTEVERLHP